MRALAERHHWRGVRLFSCGCVVHAHPLVLVFGGEVLIEVEVCRCWCTFDGMCSSLVFHRFSILRDVGGSGCHYVECSFFFLFAPRWFAMGAVLFLERIACCVKSTHKEVFVSTRTDADLSAPRD